MKKLIILTLVLITIASCKKVEETKSSKSTENQVKISDENNLKVYIDVNGNLYLNGKESTTTILDQSLSELKKSNGTVYYSRAQTYQGDKSIEVVDLIAKYELPVAFYTDKTFTERIGL